MRPRRVRTTSIFRGLRVGDELICTLTSYQRIEDRLVSFLREFTKVRVETTFAGRIVILRRTQ
jgi:hypothetical protein